VLAATSLVPLLKGNASRADAERRLPDENLAALRDAGLLRLAVPRSYGASRFDEASSLARSWRDLGFVSRHPAFGYEVNREVFGQWA
jgi:alkylation response protein AidB-like acyl-CoA dehydrogenase